MLASGDRDLKQAPAARLPTEARQRGGDKGGSAGAFSRPVAAEPAMTADGVVIVSALGQCSRQIRGFAEVHAIEVPTADRADQTLDPRMRNRPVGDRLDLLDLDDAQVGEPAVEAKPRVVIGADAIGRSQSGCEARIYG